MPVNNIPEMKNININSISKNHKKIFLVLNYKYNANFWSV